MPVVALINSGLCNLDSVRRAISHLGGRPIVADHPEALKDANLVMLPGVGAAAPAMTALRARGFVDAIHERVAAGIPLIGICLGMQLLSQRSFEDGETECLGLIPGEVMPLIPQSADERIPHMGWNVVEPLEGAVLFAGVSQGTDFYYANSYHFECAPEAVQARTPYCGGFVASVRKDNVFGVQFHPEKSHSGGLRVLSNFLRQ